MRWPFQVCSFVGCYKGRSYTVYEIDRQIEKHIDTRQIEKHIDTRQISTHKKIDVIQLMIERMVYKDLQSQTVKYTCQLYVQKEKEVAFSAL